MNKHQSICVHDRWAYEYDQQASICQWHGPEVLFGMSFEFLKPHDRFLDIGIGTGLSSLPFVKAGLDVFGIDGSSEMLKVCRAKGIVKELKQVDIAQTPWPYAAGFFHHIIACGVLHFFGNLEPFFREVARLIAPEGSFGFTCQVQSSEAAEGKIHRLHNEYSTMISEGIAIFIHNRSYIENLLNVTGFEKLKELKFFVYNGPEDKELIFCAYIVKKLLL